MENWLSVEDKTNHVHRTGGMKFGCSLQLTNLKVNVP